MKKIALVIIPIAFLFFVSVSYALSISAWVRVVSAIDTTPPIITLTSPKNTVYYSLLITVTVSINEPTSWIGYSLDSQANVTLGTNKSAGTYSNYIFVNYGSHNIIVYANDTSGNMGASSRVYFTVMKSGGGGCGGPLPLRGCRME
jgi:hypothetical protein